MSSQRHEVCDRLRDFGASVSFTGDSFVSGEVLGRWPKRFSNHHRCKSRVAIVNNATAERTHTRDATSGRFADHTNVVLVALLIALTVAAAGLFVQTGSV